MQKSAWLSAAIVGTARGSDDRVAVCAVAQLADADCVIHAQAEQIEDARADAGAPDMQAMAQRLESLVIAGWLAPLEWGPGGELRTALTLPEGVA
jgi:predicted Rdx family selenoprotein